MNALLSFYRRLPIPSKILLALIPLLVVLAAIVFYSFNAFSQRDLNAQKAFTAAQNARLVEQLLADLQQQGLAIASLLATHPETLAAYRRSDEAQAARDLQTALRPLIDSINEASGVQSVKVHFHKRPGTSFLRVWSDKRFDDLSGFRNTILEVYRTGRSVKAIELGVGGFAVRGIAPVFAGDELIGSVEAFFSPLDIARFLAGDSAERAGLFFMVDKQAAERLFSREVIAERYSLEIGGQLASERSADWIDPEQMTSAERIREAASTGEVVADSFGDYAVSYIPIRDFSGGAIGQAIFIKDFSDKIGSIRRTILLTNAAIGVLILLIIGIIIVLVRYAVQRPLQQAITAARSVAEGNLEVDLSCTSEDEIAELLGSMRTMTDSVGRITAETNALITSVRAGKLATRGRAGEFGGAWGQLVNNTNELVEAFTGPINVTLEYLDRIAAGDMPKPIEENYEGDFNRIRNSLNALISVMAGLLEETGSVIEAVEQGQLAFRADAQRFKAQWGELVQGINGIVDAFNAPVQVTADYVARLSRGDVPAPISENYRGDFNTTKDNLNGLIATLNMFIQDMQAMSAEHDAGNIDARLDESRFAGAYREMAAGVNTMVFGHIAMNREAMDVFGAFGQGDFNADMELLPGKKRFINETINQVRDNLNRFNTELVDVTEALKQGQLERRADSSSFDGGWRQMTAGINEVIEAFSRPLKESAEVIAAMATGDLRQRMQGEYAGELEVFSANINQLGSALSMLIDEVNQSVNSTARAAETISTTAEGLNISSREQTNQSQQIATAVEDMARTITENAMNATHTAELAEGSGRIARRGGDVLEETIGKMHDIAKVVGETADTITRLGESSQKIGEISSVIDDIAYQTNLLALNAAVEAARAGEEGRGFAVVADEVRRLAERTGEATQQIADTIKGIQSQTQEATTVMSRGTKEVEGGIALADSAGAALKEILQSIQGVLDRINQIAQASEQQSATSEEISASVSSIYQVAKDSTEQAGGVAGSAGELAALTTQLRNLMTRFKTDGERGSEATR